VILPGVIASSGGVASSYESIATVTLSTSASSISFSSISGSYSHLQVRGILKSTNTGSVLNPLYVQFNSDTTSNYSYHNLYGYNGSAAANGAASQTSIYPAFIPLGDAAVAGMFGAIIIDIPDYKNTNKYKTLKAFSGMDLNFTNSWPSALVFGSGNWRSSSAITSIQFTTSGGNFAQYSSLALYGISA